MPLRSIQRRLSERSSTIGVRIKLSDLMESLEFPSQEGRIYYDRQGGRTVRIDRSLLSDMEHGNEEGLKDVPDWQKPEIEIARAVLNDHSGRFIGSLPDNSAASKLLHAIQGQGAFRRFKDTLYQLGIVKQWFEYREKAIKAFVIDWSEYNGVEFENDVPDKIP